MPRTKVTSEQLETKLAGLKAKRAHKQEGDTAIDAAINTGKLEPNMVAILNAMKSETVEDIDKEIAGVQGKLMRLLGESVMADLGKEIRAAVAPLRESIQQVPDGFVVTIDKDLSVSFKAIRTRTTSGGGVYRWISSPEKLPDVKVFTEKHITPASVRKPDLHVDHKTYESLVDGALPGFPKALKAAGKSVSLGPSGSVLRRLATNGFNYSKVSENGASGEEEGAESEGEPTKTSSKTKETVAA